jgi:hypothetical protein
MSANSVRTNTTSAIIALLLSCPAVVHGELDDGPRFDPQPTTLPAFPDEGCVTGQTNDINAQLGLVGPYEIQQLCHAVPPGDPGDLKGLAFPLEACMDGGIDRVALNFRIGMIGDFFHLYVWRDLNGLPNDACGLEAYASREEIGDLWPFFSMHELCDIGIPVVEGERIWVGAVYWLIDNTFGAHWYLGRNTVGGLLDQAYVNESGAEGDWVDLFHHARGNRFGVFVFQSEDCGAVPVEATSWGAVKALMR